MVRAGPHQLEAKLSGFLNNVFGGGRIGSHGVLVVAGRVSKYRVHWVRNGSKWVGRLDQDI